MAYENEYIEAFQWNAPNAALRDCVFSMFADADALGWWLMERYLKGSLGKDSSAVCGDGETFHLYPPDDDSPLYYAWTPADTFVEPNDGDYDEATVKYYIRSAFDKMWELRPERRAEIEAIIQKYAL
jgi:hypothetical protein